MVRAILRASLPALLIALTAPAIALAAPVDWRLSVERAPELSVEVRLRGDTDGETLFHMPQGQTDLRVRGGKAAWRDARTLIVRHRPESRLTLSYRITPQVADAEGLVVHGALLAIPEGRASEPAQVEWRRPPKDWTVATSLDGAGGTVADVMGLEGLAGRDVVIVPATRGVRVAARGVPAGALELVAERLAALARVEQTYWGHVRPPGLIVLDLSPDDPDLVAMTAERRVAQVVGRDLGTAPSNGAPAWLVDGVTRFVADRISLRSGAVTPAAVARRLDAAQTPDGRGRILMLKWDEDVRRATQGRADLDDVLLRMRTHARLFPPGQAPDPVTGLVSAAWVTAQLDLRADIARYGEGSADIPLPERLFDGCLEARVTVQPGFDSGFDHVASFSARTAKGVRRRGPAWNSGLRDGMRIDSWTLVEGDMTREIQLDVRPARGRARAKTLRYWPYGDRDVETRRIHLGTGLSDLESHVCPRKLAGE
jgi:hypothetical protein